MAILIVIGSLIMLAVWYLISQEFYKAAEAKGFPQKKYLWITFFFGALGALLVVALPDRGNTAVVRQPVPNTNSIKNAETVKKENAEPNFNNMSNIEKLEYYKKLLDSGKITEDEYIQMRKTLIGQ